MALHAVENIIKTIFDYILMKFMHTMGQCINKNILSQNLNAKLVRKNKRSSFFNENVLVFFDGL